MNKMYIKKILLSLVAFSFAVSSIVAQELNAKITINSDKVQNVSKEVITELQNSLMQLVNENKWSEATFNMNERIDCTFSITVNEVSGDEFKAEILVTARRPVYNSSYITSLFNFRDTELTFNYTQGLQLEYNETMVTNNLVGAMSFYAYIIMGLDFDSFALNGGRPYFEQAMNIANISQSFGDKGWTPFESEKNRYALALALTEESSSAFHTMWYNYHRKGLDEMAANPSRGRIQVFQTINDLNAISQARPTSVLLQMYSDTKLDELVSALSKATAEEKKEARDILSRLFPTKSSVIDQLKN